MAPREGHLHAMKRVFGYLKKFPKGKIVVDSGYRDNSAFKIRKVYHSHLRVVKRVVQVTKIKL